MLNRIVHIMKIRLYAALPLRVVPNPVNCPKVVPHLLREGVPSSLVWKGFVWRWARSGRLRMLRLCLCGVPLADESSNVCGEVVSVGMCRPLMSCVVL
jgi:hypothetical protein